MVAITNKLKECVDASVPVKRTVKVTELRVSSNYEIKTSCGVIAKDEQ